MPQGEGAIFGLSGPFKNIGNLRCSVAVAIGREEVDGITKRCRSLICNMYGFLVAEAVLAIRPGRRWPTQTRSWPTQTARVIPVIPTYTTPVDLPKICLAFDWPTQMKIPRTAAPALLF